MTTDLNSRLPSTAIHTTRVGGATFKKVVSEEESVEVVMHETHTSILQGTFKNQRKSKSGHMQQRANIHRKKNRFAPDYGQNKYKKLTSADSTLRPENEVPLQLANINELMRNLEKTGNF